MTTRFKRDLDPPFSTVRDYLMGTRGASEEEILTVMEGRGYFKAGEGFSECLRVHNRIAEARIIAGADRSEEGPDGRELVRVAADMSSAVAL